VVFIVCEGNEFQGALDKVWKLNEVLMKEPAKCIKMLLITILKW
jgi:hypothetical protein